MANTGDPEPFPRTMQAAGMRRREFIALVGGAAAAWPMVAQAQQSAMPVIGFLGSTSAAEWAPYLDGFRRGLSEAGYVEGRNVAIEYRWAEGQFDRLPALAADLVRRQVAVIATSGGAAPALAAKTATTTIPIVFATGTDPVKTGLVASFNKPGGNVTGVTLLATAIVAKRLELLRDLVPGAATIAILHNPDSPEAETILSNMQEAVRLLGLAPLFLTTRSEHEFDAAFERLIQQRADALFIGSDRVFAAARYQLAALATRHRVPASHDVRDFAVAGGLMSYGANTADSFRQAGAYVGRILQGAKPADLPVLQPTKLELVINLKTAKALGLEIPPKLLFTADEVIE